MDQTDKLAASLLIVRQTAKQPTTQFMFHVEQT